MIDPETENGSPALEEASRELQAAGHDAQVAFDCIALGDIDRAHTHALTAKVAADAAVTALAAALSQSEPGQSEPGQSELGQWELGQWEPGRSEPGRSEPGQSKPGLPDDAR